MVIYAQIVYNVVSCVLKHFWKPAHLRNNVYFSEKLQEYGVMCAKV